MSQPLNERMRNASKTRIQQISSAEFTGLVRVAESFGDSEEADQLVNAVCQYIPGFDGFVAKQVRFAITQAYGRGLAECHSAMNPIAEVA